MSIVSTVEKRTLPLSHQRYVSIASAALATFLLSSGPARAVDVDAGDYTALPPGTNLAMGYYQFATRDALYSGGNKAPINAGLDSHIGILRGVHFTIKSMVLNISQLQLAGAGSTGNPKELPT